MITNFDWENPKICNQSGSKFFDNCSVFWTNSSLFSQWWRRGNYQAHQKYFSLVKIPKYFVFSNFFLKYCFLLFFLICLLTAKTNHFLGHKIQKHFVFRQKYFTKLFFYRNIVFPSFILLKILVNFWGPKFKKIVFWKNNFRKYFCQKICFRIFFVLNKWLASTVKNKNLKNNN